MQVFGGKGTLWKIPKRSKSARSIWEPDSVSGLGVSSVCWPAARFRVGVPSLTDLPARYASQGRRGRDDGGVSGCNAARTLGPGTGVAFASASVRHPRAEVVLSQSGVRAASGVGLSSSELATDADLAAAGGIACTAESKTSRVSLFKRTSGLGTAFAVASASVWHLRVGVVLSQSGVNITSGTELNSDELTTDGDLAAVADIAGTRACTAESKASRFSLFKAEGSACAGVSARAKELEAS